MSPSAAVEHDADGARVSGAPAGPPGRGEADRGGRSGWSATGRPQEGHERRVALFCAYRPNYTAEELDEFVVIRTKRRRILDG
ncbi:hypothetical protein AB0D61_48420, partial [Streptomyces sp. NPDC048341]